jgi:outer membrane protein assembly factor BamB
MRRGVIAGLCALALAVVILLFVRAGEGARRTLASSSSPSSGASPAAAIGPAAARRAAVSPSPPTRPLVAKSLATGTVVVAGGYGGGEGQFGRRRDPESNPEAPMAVAAGPDGQLAVVDQVNRRILRYKDGKLVGTINTGGDTVQDLAFGKDGKLLVLDRLVDGNVQVYGKDGKLVDEVAIGGKGVPEGGSITGLFSDDDGVYVERDHQAVVRIADGSGRADPSRPELVGRPSRDGRLLLAAELAGDGSGDVAVSAVDRASGQPAWKQVLHLGIPVIHIITLDSDRTGMVYVAVDVGRESPTPPYVIGDERILLARLGGGGAPRGMLEIPPLPTADESFRPITVDDDGSVYVMAAGDDGLTVTRYVFP